MSCFICITLQLGYSITALEGWGHTLVWLEIAFFIIWTCAAISLTSRPNYISFNSETLLIWANQVLLAIAIFSITAAAIASLADRTIGMLNIISQLYINNDNN